MKKLALAAVVLCSCAIAFRCEDTKGRKLWARGVEPFLTGAQWRPCHRETTDAVIPTARCDAQPVTQGRCAPLETRAEAVETLVLKSHCTDAVITALEQFAVNDRTVWSDVAAAYLVRAERDDRASDLLAAFAAASRAVEELPDHPAAQFNLALAAEAIGLTDVAEDAWTAFLRLDSRSGWANEARGRLSALRHRATQDGLARWKRNLKQLNEALVKGDEAAVTRLIQPFPDAAVRYFDEHSYPVLAAALAKRLGSEPLVLDTVAWLSLRKRIVNAQSLPLAAATDSLMAAEREAIARSSKYLAAESRAMLGYVLFRHGAYAKSSDVYESLLSYYRSMHDHTKVASLHRSLAGNYTEVGHRELALREALLAVRNAGNATLPRIRHTAVGELAKAARFLGYPQIGVRFQTSAIKALQKQLLEIPPEQVESIQERLEAELSVAYRERARYQFLLGDTANASADFSEAMRLQPAGKEDMLSRIIDSRMAEMEGQQLLTVDPARAIAALQRGIERLQPGELPTFRAALLLQQADAHRIAHQTVEEKRAVELALKALEEEQATALKGRKPGDDEEKWGPYFARFNNAYERLVRLLVDSGEEDTAFVRVERASAFEVLDLVRKRPFVSREFLELTKDGQPLSLSAIQQRLPADAVMLRYFVTVDRTYTWIIAPAFVDFLTQDVPRTAIERWTTELQRAGRRGPPDVFVQGLTAPYDRLLAKPLERIRRRNGGRDPGRLVIVADGPMYGLPFAALRSSATRRHLIQDMPVEIGVSATLYVFSLLRDRELFTAEPFALLIGNPTFDKTRQVATGLDDLPSARDEVETIRQYYLPRVDVLLENEATVAAFLRMSRNKTIVHFAGHAIVSTERPEQSQLLFAKTADDGGVVEAEDLVSSLSLEKTRLFVLAACSSAGGFPSGTTGVAPLVRPLLGAGVPAVIGALWDVDDATTKRVFVSFHRHYRQGSDAAVALRAAQLELLRPAGLESVPIHAWASFQVIGHAASPFAPTEKENHLGVIHRSHSVQRDARIHPQ